MVIFLAIWWLVLSLSTLLNGGALDQVNHLAFISSVIFATGLVFGSLFKLKNNKPIKAWSPEYKDVYKISVVIVLVGISLQLYVYLDLIKMYLSGQSMLEVRRSLFSGDTFSTETKVIFNWSSALTYNYLVASGFVYLHIYRKSEFLIAAFLYLLVTSIFKGSRAELYQFIAVGLIYVISISNTFDFNKLFKGRYIVLSGISLFIIVIVYIGFLRGGSDFFNELIEYHMVGMVLFSKYIDGVGCWDAYSTFDYGLSLLGGLDYLISLVARYMFDTGFIGYGKAVAACQDLSFPVVQAESVVNGSNYYRLSGYNSFYTLLFSGHRAFGFIGILIVGVSLGLALRLLIIRANNRDMFSAFYLFLMLGMTFMGIFSSYLGAVGFWLTLMLLNFKYATLLIASKLNYRSNV